MSTYPTCVVEALTKIGLSIDSLPVLELKEDRDYIDFIRKADVPKETPIMRFATLSGRCGLAVRVQSRDGEIDGVFSFHYRFSSGGTWVRCGHDLASFEVNPKYDALHKSEHLESLLIVACPLCPKFTVGADQREFLCDLLLGLDPVLVVYGRVNELPEIDWKTKFEIARKHCLTLCGKMDDLYQERNKLNEKCEQLDKENQKNRGYLVGVLDNLKYMKDM